MPTNLAIDDRLLNLARRLGEKRTKKETVNEALREYVARRKRLRSIRFFGTVDFDPRVDYKRDRAKR